MAISWTHGGWRRESGTQAKRDKLILHIEEVEARLADFQSQGFEGQSGQRYQLEAYLDRLEERLAGLEAALGLDVGADAHTFIEARPKLD